MHTLHMQFRLFINIQIKFSNWFDCLLHAKFRIDGYQDFVRSVVPSYLHENHIIYDIGGS